MTSVHGRIGLWSASLSLAIFTSQGAWGQTVIAPPAATPNQKAEAAYLQKVCTQLAANGDPTASQGDLAAGCAYFETPNPSAASLRTAYAAISGQQINALGPQTKKFATLQQDNLTARLNDLHHGVHGASLSGLTIVNDDGTVLANGASRLEDYLPAGASGDGNGDLLDGRLGLFVNGSVKTGSKRPSKNSLAFDISDNSVTAGADYRITDNIVVGAAYGSGNTKTVFDSGLGRLDLHSTGVSVYASNYGNHYYVDLLGGYGRPNLDTSRHLGFSELPGDGTVDNDAEGRAHLRDVWAGLSIGSPVYWRAFTLTPEGSLNYHEIHLNGFGETMTNPTGPGSGLALNYSDAVLPSLQGRLGLRAGYTWTTPWGVLAPDIHGTFIREFRNHPDHFGVQFENAPDSGYAILQSDPPEGHYWANGGGLSFQLAHAISGFVDYEQLRTLKTIKAHEFSFGVRIQI